MYFGKKEKLEQGKEIFSARQNLGLPKMSMSYCLESVNILP